MEKEKAGPSWAQFCPGEKQRAGPVKGKEREGRVDSARFEFFIIIIFFANFFWIF